MIQGDELTIQEWELLSKLIKQSTRRVGIATVFSWELFLILSFSFLWKVSYII